MATTLTVQRGNELPWEAVGGAVTFGLRTGQGALWLRDDVVRQVGDVAGRLGTRYVRGPALTGDAVLAQSPSGYGFEGVMSALERMVGEGGGGVKPMVEVGSMPLVLARGSESVGASKYRSSPPADWGKWEAFVDRLMGELVGRFGVAELRGWLFTVWDRPDGERWAGTREEYLELYERTARAIKRADRGLRVGGPTVMDVGFAEAFVDGVARESCDYVVVQVAMAEVLAGRDAWLMDLRRRVSSRLGDDVPVVVELACGDAGLDSAVAAGELLGAVLRLGERCDGVVVGSATDIDDTDGFRFEPFHGGRGLMTVNGLPKAGLHALTWLAGMREGRRVDVEWGGDGLPKGAGGLAVERGPGEVAVLVWSGDRDLRLRLARLPGSTAEVLRVSPGAGSAFEVWEEMGRPAFVDRAVLERLEAASGPVASSLWPASEALELPAGSVAMVTAKG